MKVTAEQIHAAYLANPKATQAEIAALFGVSRQCVHQKLEKLQRLGLIRRTRAWRSVEALEPASAGDGLPVGVATK